MLTHNCVLNETLHIPLLNSTSKKTELSLSKNPAKKVALPPLHSQH